jgi:hypothetical protein
LTNDPWTFPHQHYKAASYESAINQIKAPATSKSKVTKDTADEIIARKGVAGEDETEKKEVASENRQKPKPATRRFAGSPIISVKEELVRLWNYFVGPILSFSLLGLWREWRNRDAVIAVAICAGLITLSVVETAAWPHYLAPIVGLLTLIVMRGLFSLSQLQVGTIRWGRYTAFLVVGSALALNVLGIGAKIFSDPPKTGSETRVEIVALLLETPNKDLVFVRYGEDHNPHAEWVFNEADIDNAEIVWARDLGPEKNRTLREYFANRRTWLLLGDEVRLGIIRE